MANDEPPTLDELRAKVVFFRPGTYFYPSPKNAHWPLVQVCTWLERARKIHAALIALHATMPEDHDAAQWTGEAMVPLKLAIEWAEAHVALASTSKAAVK